jgi:hypothetical protein
MHRLQPVAHIWQRARDNHAHGIIEIGGLHLLLNGNRFYVAVILARHKADHGRLSVSARTRFFLGRARCLVLRGIDNIIFVFDIIFRWIFRRMGHEFAFFWAPQMGAKYP